MRARPRCHERVLAAAHLFTQTYATHRNTTFDLEGRGLSPVAVSSAASIGSYAADLGTIFTEPSTLIAHSIGCLVALSFSIAHPELVKKLILLGPTQNPLPSGVSAIYLQQAATIRAQNVQDSGVAGRISNADTSKKSKDEKPQAITAIRDLLLLQDSKGYARVYTALAGAMMVGDLSKLKMPVLLITGGEDLFCSAEIVKDYSGRLQYCKVVLLPGVGH